MLSSTNADQIDLAPKLGLNDRQGNDACMFCRMLWQKAKAKSGCDHRQGPVVAVAPIGRITSDALLRENGIGVSGKFAIVAMNIVLAVDIPDPDSALVGKTMPKADGDHHALPEQRHHVGTLIRLLAGEGVDDDLKIAVDQPRAEALCVGVAKAQLDARVTRPDRGDQVDDL